MRMIALLGSAGILAVSTCIAAAQGVGEVDSDFDAEDLAEFLLTSWQGAILRMKVERSPAALDRFKTIMFATVFRKPRPSTRRRK